MSDTFGLNGVQYGGNLRDHPVNLVFCSEGREIKLQGQA